MTRKQCCATQDKSFEGKQESKTRDAQRTVARNANLGCRGEKKQEARGLGPTNLGNDHMTDEVTELLLEPCHGELHGVACAGAAGPLRARCSTGMSTTIRPTAQPRLGVGRWAPAEGFSRSPHAEVAALDGEGSGREARIGGMEVDRPGGAE